MDEPEDMEGSENSEDIEVPGISNATDEDWDWDFDFASSSSRSTSSSGGGNGGGAEGGGSKGGGGGGDGYRVQGEVTDAQSVSVKVQGAKVTFKQKGSIVRIATTGLSGQYEAFLPAGIYNVVVSASGYIDDSGQVEITGAIKVGSGGDIALSKALPPGERRVVLTWGEKPEDLDSHIFWQADESKHVYWMNRQDVAASGVGVSLDRDDTDGHGPETTTFTGIGKVTDQSHCMVKFKVKDYSDGNLGESKGIVKVLQGQVLEKLYNIPSSAKVSEEGYYTVFTLDACTKKLHDGDFGG